ncbi:PREDICTED: probable RNA-binding protein 19 [Bactrocera latifrons]|uniref:Putative RNA-binding protein 19 n=1 Tax=Bactrocera latifrons TaxID=174628 RepID=A0A0K8VFR1_BACLA|nr:PREDICTED: probable RNA-binding protein 19 [Bactrocera latifrons]
MSRIIVKQLPKNISEEKLRGIFGTKGTITDMQLKYTPDGKFRQFCFIGYRNEEEAQEAIKYFNNICIQTSRIKVELCAALGSEDKPLARSKNARKAETQTIQKELQKEKDDKNNRKKASNVVDEIISKHKDDPDFQEFMSAHDKKRTLWANDAGNTTEEIRIEAKGTECVEGEDESSNKSGDGDEDEEKLAEKPISDIDYMKNLMAKSMNANHKKDKTKAGLDLFTIKIHNVPYKVKRQEILKFFKPLKPYSVRLPTNVHGFCYVGFKTEKEMVKAMLKNKSFIKGKQVFFSDFTEKNKITKSKGEKGENTTDLHKLKPTNPKWAQQEQNTQNEEGIAESGRIFFRNLAYTVTEEDLQNLFEKFGPIAEINVPVDTITRQIKGFGTVTFVMPEHALQAFNKLDGTDFHGRLLHLIPGKSRDDDPKSNENDPALTFKQKKALKLKKSAQQSGNWNTLFLGSNAVAEILAKRFSTTKEKVLDTSEGGSSAAVRIALGETQIVIEMKNFLEENGVRLSVFDAPTMKRSKTIILAKNLPADTTVTELTPIFAKFGPIGRLVLPPSGVTALIEFCDPSEAKHAFKKLAYSKFKNVPLYLEWAPEQTFTTMLNGEPIIPKQEEEVSSHNETITQEALKSESTTQLNVDGNLESKTAEDENSNIEEDLVDEAPEPNTTLFLRNLNFKTVPDTLQSHFKHLGPIHTVEIAKRKDPKNPRIQVSMGYGFIQFKLAATTEKALKEMQFTQIDGNQVELKRSDRILKTSSNMPRKHLVKTQQTGTKMLVRNIPFQAKEKEVREVFKAFGELRSVRLPKKMTPGADSHRGFGFVDFITKSDAKKAFEALSQSTHLYGRRLVLEWASPNDDDVEEIRKRTANEYYASTNNVKRSRKSVFNTTEHLEDADEDDE